MLKKSPSGQLYIMVQAAINALTAVCYTKPRVVQLPLNQPRQLLRICQETEADFAQLNPDCAKLADYLDNAEPTKADNLSSLASTRNIIEYCRIFLQKGRFI